MMKKHQGRKRMTQATVDCNAVPVSSADTWPFPTSALAQALQQGLTRLLLETKTCCSSEFVVTTVGSGNSFWSAFSCRDGKGKKLRKKEKEEERNTHTHTHTKGEWWHGFDTYYRDSSNSGCRVRGDRYHKLNLENTLSLDVPLAEFMYLVFTRMPGES